ncbi:maleylacetoacetate isomerase [Sphingobium estronivorans]|uniref:maleylacetoacetate isomerase n=1 Tax=Sphingobium estronivorans TaxID=1577690 RepID=UPI001238E548|nr:maleylacetoacetate isomerase [Sphingobium estronivorans]
MTSNENVRLHGFFRSSASWRVRIALALKGLDYSQRSYRLREGEQRQEAYLQLNPQGLVPALEIDDLLLTQSLAIIEYLDETRPGASLLGDSPAERARIRAFSLAIACEIHPLQNIGVLNRIRALTGSAEASASWALDTNRDGLAACAAMLPRDRDRFCFGDRPTIADICLIPQMANARRFGVDIVWDNLAQIETHCLSLPAFADTAPDKQPDFQP